MDPKQLEQMLEMSRKVSHIEAVLLTARKLNALPALNTQLDSALDYMHEIFDQLSDYMVKDLFGKNKQNE